MRESGFYPISTPTRHISSPPPTAGRHFGPPDFPWGDAVAGTHAAVAISTCPGLPGWQHHHRTVERTKRDGWGQPFRVRTGRGASADAKAGAAPEAGPKGRCRYGSALR